MKKMKQPMAMKEAPGLARRARGGAMTPSAPLSGAGNMKKKPYEGGTMQGQDQLPEPVTAPPRGVSNDDFRHLCLRDGECPASV